MEEKISLVNSEQNKKIGIIEEKIANLDKNFNKFIQNDFVHLRRLVLYLIGISITGILIPIFLKLYF